MNPPYVMSDEGEGDTGAIADESQMPYEPPPAGALAPSYWQLFPDTQAPLVSQQTESASQAMPTTMVPAGVSPGYVAAYATAGTASQSPVPIHEPPQLHDPTKLRRDCLVLWSLYTPSAAPDANRPTLKPAAASEKKKNRPSHQHVFPFDSPTFVSLLQGMSLEDFKQYVFVVLAQKLETLGKQAVELEAGGHITWIAFIDRDGLFGMGRNKVLENDMVLEEFRMASAKAAGKRIGVKLFMPDPMKSGQAKDQVAAMKKALALAHGPIDHRQALQVEVERVAANGNADRDEVLTLAAKLIKSQTNVDDRFSGEMAVIVKPGQGPGLPVDYIELTYRLAWEWADEILSPRNQDGVVSEDQVPDTKAFSHWKTLYTVTAAQDTSAIPACATNVTPNAGGAFLPPMALPGMSQAGRSVVQPQFPHCGYNPYNTTPLPGWPTGYLPQPALLGPGLPPPPPLPPSLAAANPKTEASPTPEAEVPLLGFFNFARVDLDDSEISQVVDSNKIVHYFFFEGSTVAELLEVGFVIGTAKLLVRASKLYSGHLKAIAKHT